MKTISFVSGQPLAAGPFSPVPESVMALPERLPKEVFEGRGGR